MPTKFTGTTEVDNSPNQYIMFDASSARKDVSFKSFLSLKLDYPLLKLNVDFNKVDIFSLNCGIQDSAFGDANAI